jgi:uncharacterized protein YgiM (DUF1202 family)
LSNNIGEDLMKKKYLALLLIMIIFLINIVPVYAAKTGKYYVTTANLNFRKGTNLSSDIIKVIPKGTKLKVYKNSSNGKWSKVYYGKKYGWVYNSYLTVWKSSYKNYLIIVNSYYNKISTYKNGVLIKHDPCCTGKASTPTPTGKTTIINHIYHPSYVSKETGKYYEGGDSNNPLGMYWNGLDWKGYGIHGTNNLNSLGHNWSHGCIRTKDPEWYGKNIPIGTTVLVSAKAVNNKTVAGWYSCNVYN